MRILKDKKSKPKDIERSSPVKRNIDAGIFKPGWIKYDSSDPLVYNIDPDFAYADILRKLEVSKVNKYWMSVCRRICSTYLKDKIGPPLHIRILYKKSWDQTNMQEGLGADKGAEEFRKYYNKLKSWLFEK